MQLPRCSSVCKPRRPKTFFTMLSDQRGLFANFEIVGISILEEHAHAFSELRVFRKAFFFSKVSFINFLSACCLILIRGNNSREVFSVNAQKNVMYTYFNKLILSSCWIKDHSAAVSFNEGSNWRVGFQIAVF